MAKRDHTNNKATTPRRSRRPACPRAARHAGGDSLARMGLRPQADHPDAGLLQLLEQERRLAAAWIGEDWIDTTACTRLLEEIARTPAHTLVGLLEKADRALEPARARRHEVVEPIASALDEACTMLRRQADEIAALRGQR